MNMDTIFIQAAQLGGTVFTTIAFLWYLLKTSDKQVQAQITLARALQRLTDIVERNSSAATVNTSKIGENVNALKENTETVKKNSEVVDKITNGKN